MAFLLTSRFSSPKVESLRRHPLSLEVVLRFQISAMLILNRFRMDEDSMRASTVYTQELP